MRSISWIFQPHHICTVALYLIFVLCIFLNIYVLLTRNDTIYDLRLYHVLCGLLMVTADIVMVEFLMRTRRLPKLSNAHHIPTPALIGAVTLMFGIVIGYLYFIVFNYAFSRCDKLIDALYGSELWLDAAYSLLMVSFCSLSLLYVLQRTLYGAINSNLDRVGRLWVNVTIAVVWIKVVVYKGYLSHQELCQRKELEGYWCPVMQRHYECDPVYDLKGTQKIWYYLDKGLLTSAVISCASEYFPVLLVAHWIACGGAEIKAEHMSKEQELHLSVRTLLRRFMATMAHTYASRNAVGKFDDAPHAMRPHRSTAWFFLALAMGSAVLKAIAWLFSFFYTMDFDYLIKKHWTFKDDYQLAASTVQLVFFIGLYLWTRHIAGDRLDVHRRAHSRGDLNILLGCCIVLLIKLVVQGVELEFQKSDGFMYQSEAIVKTVVLVEIQISQWLQFRAIRRLLGLNDKDMIATKRFLPWIGVAGVIMAWTHFGETFLETSLIKYQLTDQNFKFSDTSLICMIFTLTVYPADYLYAFTVSICWLELLIRYLEMGFFQIGPPKVQMNRLIEHDHHQNGHVPVDSHGTEISSGH